MSSPEVLLFLFFSCSFGVSSFFLTFSVVSFTSFLLHFCIIWLPPRLVDRKHHHSTDTHTRLGYRFGENLGFWEAFSGGILHDLTIDGGFGSNGIAMGEILDGRHSKSEFDLIFIFFHFIFY